MLKTFGVEAARASIVTEIQGPPLCIYCRVADAVILVRLLRSCRVALLLFAVRADIDL